LTLGLHPPLAWPRAARTIPVSFRVEVTEGPARVNAHVRDREIAARLVAGDETALREVYRAYAPAVHALARRVLGDAVLAEDITQEVFVRLWEHPGRFDPDRGVLRAYLLAMTHSRAVERVRSEESLRRRRDAAAREAMFASDAPDPGDTLATRDAQRAVRQALAELPAAQRVPIEMAYYSGMSYRDVAEALGEPEGTVKYRIRGGMRKMRAALQAVEVAP
jgi:RNA polymerase sigma-70 factor (ECF subfamily)